jgi:hypothetical protein
MWSWIWFANVKALFPQRLSVLSFAWVTVRARQWHHASPHQTAMAHRIFLMCHGRVVSLLQP